jgi:hypothetical protein
MAIRHLVLAALIASAFSAHAGVVNGADGDRADVSSQGSMHAGTALLANVVAAPQRTYMPQAVEGFFTFGAVAYAPPATTVLSESGRSPAPSAMPASLPAVVTTPAILSGASQSPSPAVLVDAPVSARADAAPVSETVVMPTIASEAPVPAFSAVQAQVEAFETSTGLVVAGADEAPLRLLPSALDANTVPEPGTGALMLAGLAGAGFMARRRRTR